jgi:hypothetical protein
MLMEIPYMAAHEFDARRRMISKSYYQQLRSSERQALVGPPESMREHVVAASKAMRNGDWKKCKELIINDKMNAKVGIIENLFCDEWFCLCAFLYLFFPFSFPSLGVVPSGVNVLKLVLFTIFVLS